MGRAMDRMSQVPPESTRHGAEDSILRFLSIFLAEENIDTKKLPRKVSVSLAGNFQELRCALLRTGFGLNSVI
jgi:hypothetical protein